MIGSGSRKLGAGAIPFVRLRLDITFKKIRLNAPVKVKTVKDIKLPDNLKIIQM